MLIGYLSDFQQSNLSFVINNGTTFDVCLCLVGDLHQELGLCVNHMLQDVDVDGSSQVVNIGDENVFLASCEKLVEETRVGEGVVQVTVSGWVPRTRNAMLAISPKEDGIAEHRLTTCRGLQWQNEDWGEGTPC